MFAALLRRWKNELIEKHPKGLTGLQLVALVEFAAWLDTQRSPTPREADGQALELLREINAEWVAGRHVRPVLMDALAAVLASA